MKQAVSFLEKASTSRWVDSFLRDLKIAHRPRSVSYYLGDQWLGAATRITRSGLRKLPLQQVCDHFCLASRCLLFLDHETLPYLDYSAESMRPTPEVLEDIRELAGHMTVVLFSNQSVERIEELFQPLLGIESVWFAAESGYLYRTDGTWQKLISLADKVWFNSVSEAMRTYTDNVDGAVVEESESTLIFNYKNAEEEHGSMVVGELFAQLKQLIGSCPVDII
jgi:trehalose-6-phosphatase